jgi:hypothetical protein
VRRQRRWPPRVDGDLGTEHLLGQLGGAVLRLREVD